MTRYCNADPFEVGDCHATALPGTTRCAGHPVECGVPYCTEPAVPGRKGRKRCAAHPLLPAGLKCRARGCFELVAPNSTRCPLHCHPGYLL